MHGTELSEVLAKALQPALCYLDPTIPVIDIARALASEGLCLTNDSRGNLMITRLEGYEPIVRKMGEDE